MAERVDVLIIGGGPGGLATGIAMAAKGIHTLVCEAKAYPVDKVCGEGVMPSGAAYLNRLGVDRYLAPDGCFPFRGIRYISPNGSVLTGDFREGSGLGIRRLDLSAALLRRAQDLECLEIRSPCKAAPQSRTEDGIRVQVDGETVDTRLLIGADGIGSRVRAWAGQSAPRPKAQRWGARQHYQVAPWSDYVEVYWGRGIEAYVTPCGPEQVSVAFLWDREHFHLSGGGKTLIPNLMASFPALENRLAGARRLDTPRAIGPLERRAAAPVADRVLLIGDAAGYIDAITGEGISLALAQAVAAADVCAPLLQAMPERTLSRNELLPYAHAYRDSVRAYKFFTRLALFLSRRAGWMDRLVPIFNRRPGLFEAILSANMGRMPKRAAQSGKLYREVI